MMQEQIMNTLLLQTIETDYDKVGKYNQDAVNGFADEVLDAMIECVAPSPLLRILHEIPLARQTELYESVYHVLKPGGYFVNLGFLYDDVAERDEFRKLVRFKDRTAGLLDAMRNRHVLTRDEFYARLHQVGLRWQGFAPCDAHDLIVSLSVGETAQSNMGHVRTHGPRRARMGAKSQRGEAYGTSAPGL